MKCPRCGCEIKEGHLYCERCGMEIRMVPDFEPEIENSITETLSTVAEEIEGKEEPKEPEEKNGKRKKTETKNNTKASVVIAKMVKNWLMLTLAIFIALVIAVVFVAVFVYHRYSVSYQLEQARVCAQSEDYEGAIEYLERARGLRSDDADLALLESGYYYQMGEKQKAADVLAALVDREVLSYEDKERVFENIIGIYREQERYEEINSLLKACGDEGIMNHFQQYLALPPEFGTESGNYDEVTILKLSANTAGNIYYTTDGSEPKEIRSQLYTAPIFLESGEYQIAAVFVNEYGIRSEVARSWYVIDLTVPDAPEVTPLSGNYYQPTMVEAAVPEGTTVYYTTDGTNPDSYSPEYTGPIPMPLGKSNFKFVTISQEGVSSEIVSRSFDFSLETEVSVDKAITNVIQALYNRQVLTDLQGHSHGVVGKYVFKYDTIVEIPDLGYYYVLNEYVEDESGNQTKTERLYAVEVYTGAPNRLIYDENGQMGLISLQQ